MSIFSVVKDELAAILFAYLQEPGTVKEIRKFRSYTLDETPLIILSTSGYDERDSDQTDEIDVVVVTVVKFSGQVEEEAAEKVLDDVEQVLINLFRKDGTYREDVDIYKRSIRPPSPFGPGSRYAEFYLRFYK